MRVESVRRVAVFFCYAAFFTPLVFLPAYFVFPYITPKVVYFRSLVIAAAALLIPLLLYGYAEKTAGKTWWRAQSPLAVVILIFFLSLLASLFAGVDWQRSLWDTQERMVGVFTVAHYGLFFFVCRTVFPNLEFWRRPLAVMLSVGAIVLIIAAIQDVFPNFLFNQGAERVAATLGNPIYLGGYGLFIFFTGFIMAVTSRTPARWYFGAVSLFGVWGIIASETRSALLGLLAGLFLSAVLFIKFAAGKKIRQAAIMAAIILLAFGGAVWLARDTSVVKSVPIVDRVAHISPFDDTARTRIMAWRIAGRAWLERPILGWGPNNFYYAFNSFYDPEFLTVSRSVSFQETWFDSAHNVFVSTLTMQGIVGLLAYLGIYAVAARGLWRLLKRDQGARRYAILSAGFLAAHAVHTSLVFENVTSYLYFFVFLAFLDRMLYPRSLPQTNAKARVWPFLLTGSAAVLIIFASNVTVAAANVHSFYMRGMLLTGRVQSSLHHYEQARNWHSPYESDIGWDFVTGMIGVLPEVYERDIGQARILYDTGISTMQYTIDRHPLDVQARLVYTDVLRAGVLLFDEPLTEEVWRQFDEADRLSPDRQETAYARLTFMGGTGNIDGALDLARQVTVAYPTVGEGYYHVARLLLHKKRFLDVIPVLDYALRNGVEFFVPSHLEFLGMAYAREGRFLDSLYWYDQAYRATKSPVIARTRDDLARKTQLSVPTSAPSFFPPR